MRVRKWQTLMAVGWILAGRARVACAQTLAQASEDALIDAGVRQREAGHDDVALTLFRQAFAQTHSARSQAQVGLAEQALGHWVEAEADLQGALAVPEPWIEQHRAGLENSLRTIAHRVGGLDVRGGPAGAQVRIDGRPVGILPLARPLRLLAGTVTLDVSAQDHYPVSRSVTVLAGAMARETIELAAQASARPPSGTVEPVSPAPSPVTVPGSARRGVAGVTSRSTPATLPAASPSDASPSDASPARGGMTRTLAWVTAGGAVVFLGGGVAFSLLREAAAGRYNDGLHAGRCVGSDAPLASEPVDCQDNRNAVGTDGVLAVVGDVAGGALAVTSLVLFVMAPPGQRPVTARAGCGIGLGALGITCTGTF